jgi:hypothetical protein
VATGADSPARVGRDHAEITQFLTDNAAAFAAAA